MTTWPTQPDNRTCGPSVVVVLEGLPGPWPRFHDDVLGMHRRLTGIRDRRGRLQVPWPRALGTPPWAVAREVDGRVRRFRHDEVVAALPTPVPVFLGSRWLPRHVVLVLEDGDEGFRVYNPANGAVVPMAASRWKKAWWAILPEK
jgi:hypothetical protein